MTCNIYKVGSNSWKIFTKSINEGLKRKNLWSPNKTNITASCWPDCADDVEKILIVSKGNIFFFYNNSLFLGQTSS